MFPLCQEAVLTAQPSHHVSFEQRTWLHRDPHSGWKWGDRNGHATIHQIWARTRTGPDRVPSVRRGEDAQGQRRFCNPRSLLGVGGRDEQARRRPDTSLHAHEL